MESVASNHIDSLDLWRGRLRSWVPTANPVDTVQQGGTSSEASENGLLWDNILRKGSLLIFDEVENKDTLAVIVRALVLVLGLFGLISWFPKNLASATLSRTRTSSLCFVVAPPDQELSQKPQIEVLRVQDLLEVVIPQRQLERLWHPEDRAY
jgi:hypothetical protein